MTHNQETKSGGIVARAVEILREAQDKYQQISKRRRLFRDISAYILEFPGIQDVFDPKTAFADLKRAQSHERHAKLVEFKRLHQKQRYGLSGCRMFIEKAICDDNDVDIQFLSRIIEMFREAYGFSQVQMDVIKELLSAYTEERQKVLAVRNEFSQDTALIEGLTGVKVADPDQMVVSVGPISLDLTVSSRDADSIYGHYGEPTVNYGFKMKALCRPEIIITVTRKNSDPNLEQDTLLHERQHAITGLFTRVMTESFGRIETDVKSRLSAAVSVDDADADSISKEIFNIEGFYNYRWFAWEQAKDEMIAYILEKPLFNHELDALLKSFPNLFRSADGYDFIKTLRQKTSLTTRESAQREQIISGYHETIAAAAAAFRDLIIVGGYTAKQSVALLTDKPLPHWKTTVARLLSSGG